MSQPKAPNRSSSVDAAYAKRKLAAFCIPMVGQLAPPAPHAAPSVADSQPVSTEWLESIRCTKSVINESADSEAEKLSLRHLTNLADACVRAYVTCDRPVRSDLLSVICSALAVATLHFTSYTGDARRGQKTLASIGLVAGCHVDALESIAVLAYDLRLSAGFAPPELGALVAMCLRDTLLQIPAEIEDFVIDNLEPMFEAMVTVAVSTLFPRGRGFIAPGVGPATARAVGAYLEGDVGLAVSYAPDFSCALSLNRDGVSIPMDRDTLRAVMALFLGDKAYTLSSYTSASLVVPTATKNGVLKISNAVAVSVTGERFLAIQRLLNRVHADPDFNAWLDFRAAQFGDV